MSEVTDGVSAINLVEFFTAAAELLDGDSRDHFTHGDANS